ncbi:MAG: hypothetical protein WKI04_04810 [Ferruginibacter sp.]
MHNFRTESYIESFITGSIGTPDLVSSICSTSQAGIIQGNCTLRVPPATANNSSPLKLTIRNVPVVSE